MALTIKQLNTDSSYLLTFEPIDNNLLSPTGAEALHVLLDPCIPVSSHSQSNSLLYPSFWSTSTRTPHQDEPQPGYYISSLEDLPSPDLVIISSAKNDRCHEATLRQLPRQSTKMRILAEATAAKRIRSWKHFHNTMIETLPRWEELPRHRGPRQPREDPVTRIPVPPQVYGGESGEITVAYISQKRDLGRRGGGGNRSAIGITYRPPTTCPSMPRRLAAYNPDSPIPPCPPQLPAPELIFAGSPASSSSSSSSSPKSSFDAAFTSSPSRRTSAKSIAATWRSVKTAVSSHSSHDRGVSVLFSPGGIAYSALEGYATTHLVQQAVLPLTALIQCFDSFSQPRWFRGAHSSDAPPMGQETATKLGAKAWIGNRQASDKDAACNSLVTKKTEEKEKTHSAAKVPEMLDKQFERDASPTSGNSNNHMLMARKGSIAKPTEVLALEAGEEIVMTSEGIWDDEPSFDDEDIAAPLPSMSSKRESSALRIITSTDSTEWLSFNW